MKCAACGNHSTLLCDHVIGWLKGYAVHPLARERGGKTLLRHPAREIVDESLTAFTCDMPLCEACATKCEPIHWGGEEESHWQIDDRCPIHAKHAACPLKTDFVLLTAEEANEKRTKLHDSMSRVTTMQPILPKGQLPLF